MDQTNHPLGSVCVFDLKKARCKEKFGGHRGPYEIDEWRSCVVCKNCGVEISAIKLLLHFATGEKRLVQSLAELYDRKSHLEKLTRTQNKTKCEHCERTTRIDKRIP